MYRDYGRIYKVKIEFDKDLSNEKVQELIDKYFDDEETLKLTGKTLELIWDVGIDEGSHEIENALYYVLEDDKFGTYTYEYIR